MLRLVYKRTAKGASEKFLTNTQHSPCRHRMDTMWRLLSLSSTFLKQTSLSSCRLFSFAGNRCLYLKAKHSVPPSAPATWTARFLISVGMPTYKLTRQHPDANLLLTHADALLTACQCAFSGRDSRPQSYRSSLHGQLP